MALTAGPRASRRRSSHRHYYPRRLWDCRRTPSCALRVARRKRAHRSLCHPGFGDLRPGASRGRSHARAARRVAGTAARAARPDRRDVRSRAGPIATSIAAWRKHTWLGRFISTYGWRAYALPFSWCSRAVVIYQTVTGTSAPAQTAGRGARAGTADHRRHWAPRSSAHRPRGSPQFDANLPTGILPDGGPFTEAGDKTWHIVPGTTPKVGQGTAKVVHVHRRGRGRRRHDDVRRRRRVSPRWSTRRWPIRRAGRTTRSSRSPASTPANPDFRISLSSPMTVREGCGYDIPLEASCYNPVSRTDQHAGVHQRGSLGARRGALPGRRRLLPAVRGQPRGRPRHRIPAPRAVRRHGALAPVMMQQTFSTRQRRRGQVRPRVVKADGKTCRFNPWPYPIA